MCIANWVASHASLEPQQHCTLQPPPEIQSSIWGIRFNPKINHWRAKQAGWQAVRQVQAAGSAPVTIAIAAGKVSRTLHFRAPAKVRSATRQGAEGGCAAALNSGFQSEPLYPSEPL